MDTPIRKMLKRNDYNRHKVLRKIKRRREAEKELEQHAAEKELRKKLRRLDKKPKFGDGKNNGTIYELDNPNQARLNPETGGWQVLNENGKPIVNEGGYMLPTVTVTPDYRIRRNTLNKAIDAENRLFQLSEIWNGLIYPGHGALLQVSPEFDALMLGRLFVTDGVFDLFRNGTTLKNQQLYRDLFDSFENFKNTAKRTGFMNEDGTVKSIDEIYPITIPKTKLPDYQTRDIIRDKIADLKYREALNRINSSADALFPEEVKNMIRNQVIPRRLRSYEIRLDTDGPSKIKKLLDDSGIDDINFSTKEGLQWADLHNITFEEITDYQNYKQLESELNNYVDGQYLSISPEDWNLVHPEKKNWGGDFNNGTDLIRVKNKSNISDTFSTILHEARHWMDKHVKLTRPERTSLMNSYGKYSTGVKDSELVTTNAELRNRILEMNGAKNAKNLKVQDDIIKNFTSDDEIIKELGFINGYGNKIESNFNQSMNRLYNKLEGLGWSRDLILDRIKVERHNFAEDIRHSLKYVGASSTPLLLNNKTK